MTWKLWVDDQLDDPETPVRHTPEGYFGARSSEEAKALVLAKGPPTHMDLDHDLGETDRIMDFLAWLSNEYPDGPVPSYWVHSRNPVAAKNVEAYLASWKKSLG